MHIVLFILSITIGEVLSACAPKSVKFVNFKKNPKRSETYMIKLSIENCDGETLQFYEFNLIDMTNNKVIKTIRAPDFIVKGYSFDVDLAYNTTYKVNCSVSHYPDMEPSTTVSDTFQFVPDNMHIEIKGGPKINHPAEKDLEIDAESLSHDFSFTGNEHSLSDNDIKWTISPEIPGFTPPNSLKFKVPGSFLKEGQTYDFSVTVTRNRIPAYPDVQKASQTVKIVSNKTPVINIECIRNCENPNPEETTTFRAICTGNCENVTYEWDSKPQVDKSQTDLGNGYRDFVIEGGAFKPGDKVEVSVKSGESESTYPLEFKKKMTKGQCTINPKSGISGITLFNINCIDFSSTGQNLKYMIYQMQDEKGVMVNEDNTKRENHVYLSEGSPAKIVVKVHDEGYELENVELEVDVQPHPIKTPKDAYVAVKNITAHDSLKSSEPSENDVVQAVSYLLDAIEAIDPITDEAKKDLHKHLAETLEEVRAHDFDSSQQMILILTKLEKFKIDTDTKTSRLIGKSTVTSAAVAHKYAAKNKNVPISVKKKMLEDVFSLSSKLLDEVPELKAVVETEIPAHDYDSYDEMRSPKLAIIDDLRSVTNNMFLSIQTLGITVLDKNVPDQKPIIFKNDLMDFETRRINIPTLMEKQIISLTGNEANKVFVPEPLGQELQRKYDFVDYQFGVLKKNAFYWHPNVSKFNTDIVLFDFFYKNLKINSMRNPFHVHLKTKNVEIGVLKGNIATGEVVAHRLKVQPGSKLIFKFKAQDKAFKVAASKCYCNKKDFDKGVEIRPDANETERTLTVEAFDSNIMYVCIKKSGAKLEYEANFAMFTCLYWDLKAQNWEADGSHCKVAEASLGEGSPLVCKCTHSSFFAGQIFAAPNVINFNIELDFYIAFVRHWFAFSLIICILLIWFILLIIAACLDKKFENHNKIHRLDDNVPGDCHIYTMVVFTGVFIDAGTTADVGFQLIGEKGSSREHLIKCRGVRMLQRDSQDWFVINTPGFLGDLKTIRLWHNCRGTQPHWYCKRIVVQHLKTGAQYCFIVEKWFSLVWGSGKISREIPIRDEAYLKSGRLLLSVNAETQFKDRHLWVSVFARDYQSTFTSLERVGALGCTFFLSMLASAMFYGIPKNAPVDSIDPKSSYFITLRDIVIFIESWLVAVPVGIIVVLLFRNSAPRIKTDKH